jgi:hypothetical protein
MNKTQKILIAIGVGVGVAYLYMRYRKRKSTQKTDDSKPTAIAIEVPLPDDVKSIDMSREEKEEYILDNIFASREEVKSGFEGARFVWNPQIEKMYPVGTINVGQEPAYADAVFLSAEGDVVADIPSSISNAEKSLTDLTDQEIELLYRVTKKMRENQSLKNEEEAVKELGVNNPNVIKLFRDKLQKRLNDIKIMKKDASWKAKWEMRKDMRKKRRAEFKERMGFSKNELDKVVMKRCGRRPFKKSKYATYKKCVDNIANQMRSQIKSEIRSEVDKAPVSVKQQITDNRQKQFAKQMTNRSVGGVSAGKRWDGQSNQKIEGLVDKGLV